MDCSLDELRGRRGKEPRNNRLKYELHRRLRSTPNPAPSDFDPRKVFSITNIELTNRCPMRCTICPRTEMMTRARGDMQWDVFRRIVDELAEVNIENAPGFVLYLHHFGESLLNNELDRFGAYANGLGLFTSISINPILLTRKVIARLLNAEIGLVQIALDGYDNHSFNAVRGIPNAYDRSCDRLFEFLREAHACGSQSVIVLNRILIPGHEIEIQRRAAYWRTIPGLDAVYIKPFVTWNGASASINSMAGANAAPAIGPVLCREPFVSLSVAWDGDVLACCFDFDKAIVLGNVQCNSLMDIWNGPRLREIRREFASGLVSNPLCRDCCYLRAPMHGSSVLDATRTTRA
jgi:radical SAM protein with 4Fe4S-binding SPASM domain